MNFNRQTSHTLHEEHRANLDLLGRAEQALARAPRGDGPRAPELVKLVVALARSLEQDINRHFGFEEGELFPRMAEAGDGEIAMLLTEEHEAIREVAEELLPLTRAAAAGTLDGAGWDALKRGALELVERQVAHIQKEEMALLPLLDDLLDDETDRRLAFDYAAG
ncbi:hemerythrin domain-containing protein [Rhodoferax sp.]|uniref:hemerythrin domain-containing protein n=1 Tax=Rhodoferax sp. TaxID=50421 RepID=UPI00276E6B13|nr:hemerythrin domain-containing protein [Rhodoferax sp.]